MQDKFFIVVQKFSELFTITKEAILFLALDKMGFNPESEESWREIRFSVGLDLFEEFRLVTDSEIVLLRIKPSIGAVPPELPGIAVGSHVFTLDQLQEIQNSTKEKRLEWNGKTWDISKGVRNKTVIL